MEFVLTIFKNNEQFSDFLDDLISWFQMRLIFVKNQKFNIRENESL